MKKININRLMKLFVMMYLVGTFVLIAFEWWIWPSKPINSISSILIKGFFLSSFSTLINYRIYFKPDQIN